MCEVKSKMKNENVKWHSKMKNYPEEFAEFPGPKSLKSPAQRAISRGESMPNDQIPKQKNS